MLPDLVTCTRSSAEAAKTVAVSPGAMLSAAFWIVFQGNARVFPTFVSGTVQEVNVINCAGWGSLRSLLRWGGAAKSQRQRHA